MSCTNCINLNPIPSGLAEDATEFQLSGLVFADNTGETLTARIRNTATGRVDYYPITTDGSGIVTGFDIFDMFPVPEHRYEIKFVDQSGVPVTFTLTNPDDSEDTGCCVEVSFEGCTTLEEWTLTSQTCTV